MTVIKCRRRRFRLPLVAAALALATACAEQEQPPTGAGVSFGFLGLLVIGAALGGTVWLFVRRMQRLEQGGPVSVPTRVAAAAHWVYIAGFALPTPVALLISAAGAAGSENRLAEIGVLIGIFFFGAMALLGLLMALAEAEVVFGLYRGKPWARWVAVGFSGLLVVVLVGSALGSSKVSDQLLLAGFCMFPASVVALLLTPRAAGDFRH